MDWGVFVAVLAALMLWPLVVIVTSIPLLLLGRSLVRRRIRRAMGRAAGWRQMCGSCWPFPTAESRQ